MGVVIHYEPGIRWHGPFAKRMTEGLDRIGMPYTLTRERIRQDGLPILLGTTLWRGIEATGPYLLVDRCSFGDTERYVSLVRDGHGRRGDHRVPENHGAARWERHGVPIHPWRTGHRVVLCGQTEAYSPRWTLDGFYRAVPQATHFRPHPAGESLPGLPIARDFENVRQVVTLNSSVGVQSVIDGIPTVAMDEGSMAWDVTSHRPEQVVTPDREPWLHWLAWTQWSHEEISEGAWKHLLD